MFLHPFDLEPAILFVCLAGKALLSLSFFFFLSSFLLYVFVLCFFVVRYAFLLKRAVISFPTPVRDAVFLGLVAVASSGLCLVSQRLFCYCNTSFSCFCCCCFGGSYETTLPYPQII